MTTIFAGTKQHDDTPHAETIEVDESTGILFHTIIHEDGTIAHEQVRQLSPEHVEQYLSHIPHWHAKGFGAEHITYTQAQHDARAQLHAKHRPTPRLLTEAGR